MQQLQQLQQLLRLSYYDLLGLASSYYLVLMRISFDYCPYYYEYHYY